MIDLHVVKFVGLMITGSSHGSEGPTGSDASAQLCSGSVYAPH